MPSPLPGMDPYLEAPGFWSSFHSRLIVALADAIEAKLSPEYYVEVETRVYLSEGLNDGNRLVGIPDAAVVKSATKAASRQASGNQTSSISVQLRPQTVEVPMPEEVTERYLEIRGLETGEVITVIELLSPKNKRPGQGRVAYEEKRNVVLSSCTHLIELDLLRAGEPMVVLGQVAPTPYRILISPSDRRPSADLYGVTLQQPLPEIPICLKPSDSLLRVNLQAVLNGVYDRGRYRSRIDYSQAPPPPALPPADQDWLTEYLKQ